MIFALFGFALLASCTTTKPPEPPVITDTSDPSIVRPIPKAIEISTDAGVYRLVFEDEKTTLDNPLPTSVPVVTVRRGERIQGLRLEPGTELYGKLYALKPLGFTFLLVPTSVNALDVAPYWGLETKQHLWNRGVLDESALTPLMLNVPVDPPGPQRSNGYMYHGMSINMLDDDTRSME
ncbi:MAG: hypothetical protein SFZ23_04315 [Planctomycetota bacterium]|nr:hypothetical protein [Planctomycetota bacterium]